MTTNTHQPQEYPPLWKYSTPRYLALLLAEIKKLDKGAEELKESKSKSR